MQTALNKGLAQGRAEGRAEGKAEAIRENAKRMKTDGLSVEQIAKYTGLTVDDIDSL
jgi:predicted transposase/invertase (TIGR01784 family)